MANKYTQAVTSGKTRFSAAPMAEIEFSTMMDNPTVLTTCSAGDIIPIKCMEVLPHDTFDVGLDFVTRQATVAVPVMGQLVQDFYAFFVPNRIVNKSWKNVMGENSSGAWTAPAVSLAPLVGDTQKVSYNVPVGSVADYYGFPTQGSLPAVTLQQCHDLKFRGYLSIYNNYFRDQNWQPPIPFSTLNVCNNFFDYNEAVPHGLTGVPANPTSLPASVSSDGSYPNGSVVKELYGDGATNVTPISGLMLKTSFNALGNPLKANKMHDYFTSVLPSPQKGRQVALPVIGQLPIVALDDKYTIDGVKFGTGAGYATNNIKNLVLKSDGTTTDDRLMRSIYVDNNSSQGDTGSFDKIVETNAGVDLAQAGISISVSDLRLSSAIQRVYELLGNGGSRYTEFINSFFGLEVDNPFDDIPTFLGHFRRDLDLFQTAQTSASPSADSGAGTPQGNLSAFGFTNKNGSLFTKTFLEHGYVHIISVIRHKNVYASTLSRDNFRMSMLDFYSYPLANISEQPVYTREINPFYSGDKGVFGYQEAWAEYRYEPDTVSGYMRPGIDLSLSMWNYADPFALDLNVCSGSFLKSNTAEVVTRSTAVQDRNLPQFKLQCMFSIKKERPMPVYSVPGADIF